MANGKQVHLDRLAQLSEDNLAAVVSVVEQALLLGDGWLQREGGVGTHDLRVLTRRDADEIRRYLDKVQD